MVSSVDAGYRYYRVDGFVTVECGVGTAVFDTIAKWVQRFVHQMEMTPAAYAR